VEDQSTDTSDLTDTGDATGDDATDVAADPAPARGVPVGKRGGRHRYFRPRPSPATPEATAETATQLDETSAATEITETVAAEAPGVDQITEVAETEPAPKPKRRRWFGRRPTEPTEPAELVEPAETAALDIDAAESGGEEPESKPAPKQAGKRMAVAVAVAAVLFVAAGAFGGAMLQPYLSDRAIAETKLTIARTATDAITTLFTYSPDDMDQLAARSSKYLGGDLKDAYAKQVDALAATNKQNQISRSAEVVGTAVESLNGTDATAIVYANITYNSAATKDLPKIFLVSYRLTMQRDGSDWVITNMPWITSKDLTRLTP
jgi:Mce-associated membrane protein